MTYHRILIVGGGTMGSAMLFRMMKMRFVAPSAITVVERSPAKRRSFERKFRVQTASNVRRITFRPATVILAVKPQDAQEVLKAIRPIVTPRTLIISIMAGVSTRLIRDVTKTRAVVRVMPNLPFSVGSGFSVWFRLQSVKENHRSFVRSLLTLGGREMEVGREALLDVATAVSGSGPAYVFTFVDDLISAAMRLGLRRSVAETMVIETVRGGLALLETSRERPDVLRRRVTSKGGTTELAIRVLNHARVRDIWISAIQAAWQRAKTLSRALDILRR